MNKITLYAMLQKLTITYCLLFSLSSFGQHSVCKEYYCDQQDDYKRTLISVTYYDKHQNVARKVSISGDGITSFDTTDYTYENNLLIKKSRYWLTRPLNLPVDSVLSYINSNPSVLGHSLHNIIQRPLSDTELTTYIYDPQGLLIKKENAIFGDDNDQIKDSYYNDKGTKPTTLVYTQPPRVWKYHRVTNYIYDGNNRLIEANGDLYDRTFGYNSEYGSSARKYFYNPENKIALDSIVSYTGSKFDGAVSLYTHHRNGYEIRKVSFGSGGPAYCILVFKFDNEGKIKEESLYDTGSIESKIKDPQTRLRERRIYEYERSGMLSKKSTVHGNNIKPENIIYYVYE